MTMSISLSVGTTMGLRVLLSGWTLAAPVESDAGPASAGEAGPTLESPFPDAEPTPAPAPVPAPATASPPTSAGEAQPEPPVLEPSSSGVRARKAAGSGFAVAGAVGGGAAAVGLLLVSLPTLVAAEVAEDRADDGGGVLTSESTLRGRAQTRREFARDSAIVCGYIALGGVALAGVGAAIWPWRAERERKQQVISHMRVAPGVSREGASLGVSGRF